MKNHPTTEGFTMISDDLFASKKLNGNDKLLTAYFLRWQLDGKVCFMSNDALCNKSGLGLTAVKDAIDRLEEHGFLNREHKHFVNEYGKWVSEREITVDKERLQAFLDAEKVALKRIFAEKIEAKKQATKATKKKMTQSHVNMAKPTNGQTHGTSGQAVSDELDTDGPPPAIDEAPYQPATVEDIFPSDFDWSNITTESKSSPSAAPVMPSCSPTKPFQADAALWTRSRVFKMCAEFEAEIIASGEVWEGDIRNRISNKYYERHRSEVDHGTSSKITGWIWEYQPSHAA